MLLDSKWRQADLLEAALETSVHPLLICDTSLNIVGANGAARKLFGPINTTTRCRDVLRCVGDCDAACLFRQALSRPSLAGKLVRFVNALGEPILAEFSSNQLRTADGRLAGILASVDNANRYQPSSQPAIIAESPAMREVLRLIGLIGPSRAGSILLEGESGAGRSLIAAAIHYQSFRGSRPFVSLNCAALPLPMLEAELFGGPDNSVPSVNARKRGLIELAGGGTLFLEEVSELPPALQRQLLRLLEGQAPAGAPSPTLPATVRIVSAATTSLRHAVEIGAFRKDLYYRLSSILVPIPPLRARSSDILPLARHFIQHFNQAWGRRVQSLSPEAEQALLAYSWPGNVRELRNSIERAMIAETSDTLTPSSLGLPSTSTPGAPADPATLPSDLSLLEHQRRLLIQALTKTRGNQAQAARLLGIGRDSLRYKIKKLHLDPFHLEPQPNGASTNGSSPA